MKKTFLTIAFLLVILEVAKTQTHPITIHSNGRVASLQMTAAEYSSWITNDEFTNNSSKRQALIQEIYQTFDDKFDFIFLVLNETTIPTNFPYYGELISTSNVITGIGLSIFNADPSYNSDGKLKSVMQLSARDYLMTGPALHELAHNWANFAIPTKDWNGTSEYDGIPHWGFTGGNTPGQLGGFQQNTLQINIGGNPNKYSVAGFGGIANGGNSVKYSELELYLMGMIPLTGVSNFDVFKGLSQVAYVGSNIEFTASSRVTYDNAKILADAGGLRVPSYTTSQKNFRLLVVMLTPAPLTETEWTNADSQSEWFGRTSDGGLGYVYNFWEATRGLGTIETGNLQDALRTSQLSLTPTSITLASSLGSNGHIIVNSNISWTASVDESWLNITPANGSNNSSITVTAITENTSTSPRTGIISITGSGLTRTVSVTQNGPKVYQLEYVSGGNQTYTGGGIPYPIIVKIKNLSDNVYVTNLVAENLEIKATSSIGYQDLEFNNSNNYCNNGDNGCYGGSYYVPANSGSAYVLTVSVALRKNNQDISIITITENITGSLPIPVIVTRSITELTTNSAVSGGNVTSDGVTSITSEGVCWGTSLNPTILNNKSNDGNGNVSFSSRITGLTPNTSYHTRAYATNSEGTGYGADILFTTMPTSPLIGTISQPNCTEGTGSIVLNGLPNNGSWTLTRTPGGTTVTGTGSNTTVSGVPPGTYTFTVTNAAGITSDPSQDVIINAIPTLPTVTTSVVADASQTTALTGGNVISDGGSSIAARGVCWSTTSNPTILNSKTSDGLSIGTYTSIITNLTNGVTYHIRAYATNCKGTAYGLDIQYMHNSTGILEVQSNEVSVFPNPVSGTLNVVYKNDNFETIKILNSQGRLLLGVKVIMPSQQLDFSLYDSGLYILEFIKKPSEVKRIKVIKH
jgi:hypothetical protein